MSALDWIFVAVLLTSMLLGAWRGLFYEVLFLASWIAAFVLARWLAVDVARWLPMTGISEPLRYAAGFALVFIASVLLGGLIAVIVKNLLASVGLRPVDRVLGAAFGLIRGVLLLLLATVVAGLTPLKTDPVWRQSVGVGAALGVLKGLKPVLPRDLDRFLPA